jgi:stress-induced morphogen
LTHILSTKSIAYLKIQFVTKLKFNLSELDKLIKKKMTGVETLERLCLKALVTDKIEPCQLPYPLYKELEFEQEVHAWDSKHGEDDFTNWIQRFEFFGSSIVQQRRRMYHLQSKQMDTAFVIQTFIKSVNANVGVAEEDHAMQVRTILDLFLKNILTMYHLLFWVNETELNVFRQCVYVKLCSFNKDPLMKIYDTKNEWWYVKALYMI